MLRFGKFFCKLSQKLLQPIPAGVTQTVTHSVTILMVTVLSQSIVTPYVTGL
jgi:hypothetical protein